MRIHIAHDRKGYPVVEIDGHEGDSIEEIVKTYKEITKQLNKDDMIVGEALKPVVEGK